MQLKNKLMTVGCVAVAAAALIAGTACNEHELEPFSKSLSSGKKQSTSSGSARPVDILFVVDDSNSMMEEQASLDAQFNEFLERLIDANADFRLATVSTSYEGPGMPFVTKALDTGSSVLASGGVKDDIATIKAACATYYADKDWIAFEDFSKSDPDERKKEIKNLFRCQAIMGTGGDPTEKGLAAMKSALESHRADNLKDAAKNFKRPGSILAVVFVTDENDCSTTDTILIKDQCEHQRNIEDSCKMTREDSVQVDEAQSVPNASYQPTYLQLSSGQGITYNGVTKSLRDWCVQGDGVARKALENCLNDIDEDGNPKECAAKQYIDCPNGECQNKLTPRGDYYRFLIDYVISSNEVYYQSQNPELFSASNLSDASDHYAKLEDMAKTDIIIASIINRDQGIRYNADLPENWCGIAGTQGYRYQLFAEMFGNNPIYAPICCKNEMYVVKQVITNASGVKESVPKPVCTAKANGSNGEFGPVLSVIGQRIGEAVNTLCADSAPITCLPADCNERGENGYTDNPRADKAATCPCLYGCKASAPHMANTANEYYLCNEFKFNVGTLPKDTETSHDKDDLADYKPYSESDFTIDYDSVYCKTRTGSPLQINLSKTEIGRDIIFEYPKAVSGK